MPSSPGRAVCSARCRMGNQDCPTGHPSCRSDTSYRELNQWRRRKFTDRFRRLEQCSYYVVIVSLGNAKAADFALPWLCPFEIVDQGRTVDLWSLRREAGLPQQIRFLRQSLHQHRRFLAYERAIAAARDLPLNGHQTALAIVDGAPVHL